MGAIFFKNSQLLGEGWVLPLTATLESRHVALTCQAIYFALGYTELDAEPCTPGKAQHLAIKNGFLAYFLALACNLRLDTY